MTTQPTTFPNTVVCNGCGSRMDAAGWPAHLADCDGAAECGFTELYADRAGQMRSLLVELRALVYAAGMQVAATLNDTGDGEPTITLAVRNRHGEITSLAVGPHTPRRWYDREADLLYLTPIDAYGTFDGGGIETEFDGWEALPDLDLFATLREVLAQFACGATDLNGYLSHLAYERYMSRMEMLADAYAHDGY
jgi:hypothetical protein